MNKNTDNTREAVILQYVGIPPVRKMTGDTDLKTNELRELAIKTTSSPPTLGPVSLSINYVRVSGVDSGISVICEIADSFAGVLYADTNQVKEVVYTERHGLKEQCLISITQPEWQIPAMFEPIGDMAILKDDPSKYFPDDTAARWMMGLLLACQDIGTTMKLSSPYMAAPRAPHDAHVQYRTSHMMYFWRLWLGHIHEAWVAFNKPGDGLIRKLKDDEGVKKGIQRIAELRGKKVEGGVSVGEYIEKCRNTVFHYIENDGDKWNDQLKLLPKDYNICVGCGENRDVDARWLIADEYLLSRLTPFGVGNKEVNGLASDLAVEIIKLIRGCQNIYFDIRKSEFIH